MKVKGSHAILSFFTILNASATAKTQNETPVTLSAEWWELFALICIPLAFFLFSAVVSAESGREVRRKFIISAIMLLIGFALLYISKISEHNILSILAAVTGIIYAGTGLWFLYLKERYSSESRSLRELPLTAQKLGLDYIDSPVIDGPGDMKGFYCGYRVEVMPSGETGDGRFVVHMKKNLGKCEISFSRTFYKPPEGMIEFYTGNLLFDSRFKTRYATKEFAEKIRNAGDKLTPILNFIKKWRITHWWIFGIWGRSWLTIGQNTIRYSDAPIKGGSYVLPAVLVEKVIPDLIVMTRALEEIADL